MKSRIVAVLLLAAVLVSAPAGAQTLQQRTQPRLDVTRLASLRAHQQLPTSPFFTFDAGRVHAAPSPVQNFYYHRTDWEIGRGFVGSAIGIGVAYILDLVKEYDVDFSKGNPRLDERDPDGQIQRGEVFYNILIYGGITPYYTLRGIRSVHPVGASPWGGYLSGVVGTMAGLAYWTSTGKSLSGSGMLVTATLSTLFTTIGYHIF